MLARALKMAFWVMYDHIGKLMLANLVWVLAVLVPLSIGGSVLYSQDLRLLVWVGAPALLLTFVVVLPVVTVGLAYMVKELIDTRDGSVSMMFLGMRLYWRRAVGIGAIYVAAAVALTTSVWFYTRALAGPMAWVGYMLSGLALWCLLYAALMALIVMPALVQKKGGIRDTLKLTALVVADNPLFLIGLGIQILLVGVLSMVAAPLLFLFSGAWSVLIASTAYELLARKYVAIQIANGTFEAAPGMIEGAKPFPDDEEDDYLNRGLRDFIFPWKG